jgi:hypothetical protein
MKKAHWHGVSAVDRSVFRRWQFGQMAWWLRAERLASRRFTIEGLRDVAVRIRSRGSGPVALRLTRAGRSRRHRSSMCLPPG